MLFVSTYQNSLFNVIQLFPIYISYFYYPHICVLFIKYDNKKMCRIANMQPCKDCTQQMAPTIRKTMTCLYEDIVDDMIRAFM